MDTHVKAVAWIYIVLGVLGVLAALLMLVIFGGIAGFVSSQAPNTEARDAAPILGIIGGVLFFVIAIISLPSILAGWGLLNFKEWARILTIILAILHLFGFPIGTAIGVYSLWVLFNQQTLPLFRGVQPMAPAPPPPSQV
jgi:hypothetical protein